MFDDFVCIKIPAWEIAEKVAIANTKHRMEIMQQVWCEIKFNNSFHGYFLDGNRQKIS